jgi:hypothetical protein
MTAASDLGRVVRVDVAGVLSEWIASNDSNRPRGQQKVRMDFELELAREEFTSIVAERDALQAQVDAVRDLAGELFAKADECESAHYRQMGYEIDYENKGRAYAYEHAAEKLTELLGDIRSAALGETR